VLAFAFFGMLRLLAAILLMQLLAQASGLVYAASELACEDSSSEQDGDEDCRPGCADCLCCPQHRLLVREPGGTPTVLLVEQLVFPLISSLVPGGLPREIMHVPKAEAAA